MFRKLPYGAINTVAVSAVAVVLLAVSAVSAQGSGTNDGPWQCGVEQDIGIPLMCELDEDGTLRIRGQGAMRDYVGSLIGGSTAPWSETGLTPSKVKSVVLEGLVTYIGAFAFFSNNTSGFTVTITSGNQPTVGEGAFGAINMSSAILYVPEANINYYRAADVWKDFGYINPSTVTFDLQGGSGDINSQFITYGGKATKPADPTNTYDDINFAGWYQEASATTPWNFETDVVTQDITLYAKWEPRSSVAHGVRPSSAASLVTVRNRTLTVRPSSSESVSRVRLIDMRGKSVASFTARGAGSFSLGNIPAGRYFVEVREGARRDLGSVVGGRGGDGQR